MKLTEFEMTKACAEGMEYQFVGGTQHAMNDFNGVWCLPKKVDEDKQEHFVYNPLKNDEQVFGLIKRFKLRIDGFTNGSEEDMTWIVTKESFSGVSTDLNRAIVECSALVQRSVTV